MYEWWTPLALLLASVIVIAVDKSPWSELGFATIGGLTVLALTAPFQRWRDDAIKTEIWSAATDLQREMSAIHKNVIDVISERGDERGFDPDARFR